PRSATEPTRASGPPVPGWVVVPGGRPLPATPLPTRAAAPNSLPPTTTTPTASSTATAAAAASAHHGVRRRAGAGSAGGGGTETGGQLPETGEEAQGAAETGPVGPAAG